MGPLPFILGAGVLALIAAAAQKSKASTSTPKPATTSATVTTPAGTTTVSATTTNPAMVGNTPTSVAPAYLSSIPYVIAMRVIALSDPSMQQSQGIWLNDNGYPRTGEAVFKYSAGEISDVELRQIAQAEFAAAAAAPASVKPKQGQTEMDRYGAYLLSQDDDNALYNYALSSPSIPLVTQAAARLAAAGDTRAVLLTQHLADLTV